MAPDPVEIEVSLEVDIAGSRGRGPRRLRVSAKRSTPTPSGGDSAEESAALLRRLQEELDALEGSLGNAPATSGGGDRPLSELVETYRPRQPELIELLRDEGEISPAEFETLRHYLERPALSSPPGSSAFSSGAGEVPVTERPLAAAPLAQDRTPTTPRPVSELVHLYRIESVKQAGAVRARRQISYEEYMSLKRHFQVSDPPIPPAGSEPEPTDGR
ncbi:MAG: hypothetical protein L3K19_03235 [Thermoplasmata archaeon]|nr:hypothetical protein [Thermoplasmata archaeon]